MKIGKYELRKMTDEELNAAVETEGEEKVEKKKIGRKILIGLGVVAGTIGAAALLRRKNDDDCDLDSLPEAEDYADVEYTEVESED